MTIHSINPASALLSVTSEELEERGLHPHLMTRQQTETLARECLFSLGWSADSALELESYPSKEGLLLFVRIAPTVWRFPDSNALLDALSLLPDLSGQPLYRWKEMFWMTDADCAALSEFADPIRDDPFLSVRLAEYAQPLF